MLGDNNFIKGNNAFEKKLMRLLNMKTSTIEKDIQSYLENVFKTAARYESRRAAAAAAAARELMNDFARNHSLHKNDEEEHKDRKDIGPIKGVNRLKQYKSEIIAHIKSNGDIHADEARIIANIDAKSLHKSEGVYLCSLKKKVIKASKSEQNKALVGSHFVEEDVA